MVMLTLLAYKNIIPNVIPTALYTGCSIAFVFSFLCIADAHNLYRTLICIFKSVSYVSEVIMFEMFCKHPGNRLIYLE